MIQYIKPAFLRPEMLDAVVYPDLEHTYYWSDCWEPDFYAALARAGFISIAYPIEQGYCLLPEMQARYAVLDWPNLNVSRSVRRSIRQGRADGLVFRFSQNLQPVVQGIRQAYGADCWLFPPYVELLEDLRQQAPLGLQLVAAEVVAGPEGRLIAGELGYLLGRTYTSLTGFLDRSDPRSDSVGTFQLLALAECLIRSRVAFWNLGHPYMNYKLALGAQILSRADFLQRWKPAVQGPTVSLDPGFGEVGYSLGALVRASQDYQDFMRQSAASRSSAL